MARGQQVDLEKVAREQQIKYQEEMEKILSTVKAKNDIGQLKKLKILITGGRDGITTAIDESEENSEAIKEIFDAARLSLRSEPWEGREKTESKQGHGADGAIQTANDNNNADPKCGQMDVVKVTGKVWRQTHFDLW